MTLDDWGSSRRTTVLATEVPDVIERLGIAAFISPQRLVEEGDSVDPRPGEGRDPRRVVGRGPLRALGDGHAGRPRQRPGPSLRGVGRAGQGPRLRRPRRGRVAARAAPRRHRRAALGRLLSSTAAQKLVGQSVVNKEPMYTASGKISARKLKGARLEAGSFGVTTDVDIIQGGADASCPRDGVLAMDRPPLVRAPARPIADLRPLPRREREVALQRLSAAARRRRGVPFECSSFARIQASELLGRVDHFPFIERHSRMRESSTPTIAKS